MNDPILDTIARDIDNGHAVESENVSAAKRAAWTWEAAERFVKEVLREDERQ